MSINRVKMSRLSIVSILIILIVGCNNTDQEINQLKQHTARLQKEVDSLKKLHKVPDTPARQNDTVKTPKPLAQPRPKDGRLRAGKHNFTLQWISWDTPGSVSIQPAEDGWFSIDGGQKSRQKKDYITINGMIRQISQTELQFEGEIKSVVETNNGGKPCIKIGSQIFKTTQNRKYWRLQDMINCEGGMLTDYVDIYF